jgi:hypothetical protein
MATRRGNCASQAHLQAFDFMGLSGGARSPERTMLGMADFPDKREFTGSFIDFDP